MLRWYHCDVLLCTSSALSGSLPIKVKVTHLNAAKINEKRLSLKTSTSYFTCTTKNFCSFYKEIFIEALSIVIQLKATNKVKARISASLRLRRYEKYNKMSETNFKPTSFILPTCIFIYVHGRKSQRHNIYEIPFKSQLTSNSMTSHLSIE